MRSIAGKWFNSNEQHILDWYHIARRFAAIGKGLIYLPHVEDFKHRLSRHWQHLNRAMWKVWHANLYGANIALNCFNDGVNIHKMIAEGIPAGRRGHRTGSRASGRAVVVPDRKPNSTHQLRQGISSRPSHIDSAGGVDCRPAGGLADGEETAYALDQKRCANIAQRALCANQRRTR